MQTQTHCLHLSAHAGASARRETVRELAAATFLAAAAGGLDLQPGRTRYRDPFLNRLTSVDPTRILVVSKASECMVITTLVHSIGRFETRIACSAQSALAVAGDFTPEIVLLTTALPELASYRVAAALRWRSCQPAPRLIAITEDICLNDRGRALAAGFERYLTLPVHRAALESVLLGPDAPLAPPGRGWRGADN
jgi:PleD family two-component response regulator